MSSSSRCDGQRPCKTCSTTGTSQECAYGAEAIPYVPEPKIGSRIANHFRSQGKSDLILNAVLRMESFLQGMNTMIVRRFSKSPSVGICLLCTLEGICFPLGGLAISGGEQRLATDNRHGYFKPLVPPTKSFSRTLASDQYA
jgi:hypothetical protein